MKKNYLFTKLVLILFLSFHSNITYARQLTNSKSASKLSVEAWLAHEFWKDKKQIAYMYEHLTNYIISFQSKNPDSSIRDYDIDLGAKFAFIYFYVIHNNVPVFKKNRDKFGIHYEQISMWAKQFREQSILTDKIPAYLWMASEYYSSTGNYIKCISLCEQSIKIHANYSRPYRTLCYALISINHENKNAKYSEARTKRAMALLNRYVELRKSDRNTLTLYVHLYTDLKNYDKAIEYMNRVIELSRKYEKPEDTNRYIIWKKDLEEKRKVSAK